jgi:branched-chain amino acid transport system ATP-binding protein
MSSSSLAEVPVDTLSRPAPLLVVEHLRIDYGGVTALDDVSFDVRPGAVAGLIGPNGAGKTTLVDALTGYTRPSQGTIGFAGQDITRLKAHLRVRLGMSRTFQSMELFEDLTVADNLRVALSPPSVLKAAAGMVLPGRGTDDAAVERALEVTGLTAIAERHPGEISHGQRKLVGVARALVRRPSLLILDEPAAGLDTTESLDLGRRLRALPEQGITPLLIDHDMSLVLGVCDEIAVLDFGRLIARGAPRAIRTDPAVIQAYLGTRG